MPSLSEVAYNKRSERRDCWDGREVRTGMGKLRKGSVKEATEILIMALDNEVIDRERELESLKRERKMLASKLEEEERR